jgi:hypothetical protein
MKDNMPITAIPKSQITIPRSQAPFSGQLRLIRAEYEEMPGLHLTTQQAQRLWNLDAETCAALLGALVDARFLRRTAAGGYVRSDRD